ncbi:uncharacterized protein LOC108092055 [Drosophila ficusphila]|uniref:uncharacterized protein LOC108092055 n=1 Tax=Drosophila ficusphila TaxID=30025 RepID=UPI0007E737C5|nr:uncharacterized protein LOC108092055 [Drosophila ficusphila]
MALQVTVNGKFGANLRKPVSRLDDPERVRKDLESQRRITRLQQVREKSNHLARKIREEVAAEKKRQIENLEQVKQKELNAWREHVLVKKHQDYRSAIFQVGAAHRAAREENERIEQQRQEKNEKMQRCRKQALKRSGKTSVQLRVTNAMNLNTEGRVTAGTQTPMLENKENRLASGCHKPCCKGKRKRTTSCSCATTEDEEEEEEETSDSSILVCDSPTSNRRLQRTPPVILDVEIDETISETINNPKGLEINDRFMQTNRKFSHIVRPSEEDEGQRRPRFTVISDLVKRTETSSNIRVEPGLRIHPDPNPSVSSPPSPSKSLRDSEPPAGSRSPTRTATRKSPTKTSTSKSPTRVTRVSPKKTVTSTRPPQPAKRIGLKTNPAPAKVIDAGIRKVQKGKTPVTLPKETTVQEPTVEPPRNVQPIPEQCMPPIPEQPMPPMPNPHMNHCYPAPQAQPYMHPYAQQPMQPYAMPYSMPFPMQPQYPQPHAMYAPQQMMLNQPAVHVPAVTAPPSTATQSTVSTTTFVMSTRQDPKTTQSGRVQFYDHGNKYHRTYDAPTQSVQSVEKDAGQLTAMDHARIETQLRELREQELDKLRKISDDRGQKALEREQVRRDCAELTEKLDALTQQQPQLLPSDADFIPSHRFADAAARKEKKMNEALEQMLLRPAIITCPEVRTKVSPPNSTRGKSNAPNAINVGEPPAQMGRDKQGSTESCCSILLDYVDDQSKQLRSDLKAEQSNSLKSARLRNLLDRIEKIRVQLMEELKAGESAGSKGDNAQEMIDNIRRERADILSEKAKSLNERESDLQQKEAILEQRLRKFYKETKSKKSSDQAKSSDKEERPLEIIIKVKSDGTVKQYVPKGKSKSKTKAGMIENERERDVSPGSTESTPREEPPKQTEKENGMRPMTQDLRQASIDSNSTAYRSLPPVSYRSFNPGLGSMPSPPSAPPPAPLHPMIVQYIHRLLGMTRHSVDEMGVSSSYVATPSPSIINSSRNISPCIEPETERTPQGIHDETVVHEQRMERVQSFIDDNRSFINELEDSIRCQRQLQKEQQAQDTEKSLQAFDQIWNKRLAKNRADCQTNNKEKEQKRERMAAEKLQTQRERGKSQPQVQVREKQQRSALQQPREQQKGKKQSPGGISLSLPSDVTSAKGTSRFVSEKSKSQSNSEESSARQMERYAQLTENCTQRIAELTDLITKVREEKQRLVEVTLTSNSDGERQSTEYFDLPNGQKQARCRTISDRSDSQTASISEALPLQKNKPTAASRDSGIADSRPITAQGQIAVDAEPISLGSSTQNNTARGRMKAPPATIRRYSPQLDAEDLAHELSTITEVETPGQSHIVPATPMPKPFPSFDQYAREMQLDLSRLEADQSQRLQSEFNNLIQVIQQHTGGSDYREFPSITAYLQNMTSTQIHLELGRDHDQTSVSPCELMRQLRVVNDNMQDFPQRREYLEKLLSKQPADQRELIDTASIEQDSSDSFNVEEELRQRNILMTSFRRGNATDTTLTAQEVASSTRRESVAPETNDPPNESGIDPLSGSNFSSDAEQRPQCWHATIHQRQQRVDELCSSTSNSSPERRKTRPRLRGGQNQSQKSKDDSSVQDASQLGRSLNLREFLTRELLKHRVHTGSTSESSDESLRGHFLKSVLHSLSPNSNTQTPKVGLSHNTGATNDRQKTSTPVGSFLSIADKSGSVRSTGSQLFSGESHISLVHYPDGTPPVPYEQQSKQSTNQTRQTSGQVSSAHRKSPRK